MITKRQKICIVYFMSRALFLGLGSSLVCTISKQDGWISVILGIVLGYALIFLCQRIMERKKEKTLNAVLKSMGKKGIVLRILFMLFAFVVIFENIILLQVYTTSFFLLKTPQLVISATMMFLVALIANKGIKTIARVSEALFPISIAVIIFTLLSLTPVMNLQNFLPILMAPPLKILAGALLVAGIGATPYLFLLQTQTEDQKISKGYGLAMTTIFFTIFSIIAVLGANLATIFRFPAYMVLKNIELFNFIEKIENILSIVWMFDIFIILSMSTLFFKELLPQKKNKVWFYSFLILTVLLTSQFFGKNYFLDLTSYYVYAYLVLGLFLVTIPFLYFHFRKKKKSSPA